LIGLIAGAQTANPETKRSSIGIALEGGGALGLAHVGVLKWMQEHRIPIEYVGGTSMGGLVGGMYAMGLSPAELEKLVSEIDWNAVLGKQISYRDLVYRRKQDRKAFQNSLEFGLRKGVKVPGGMNTGQEITFLLDRNTLAYSNLASFDDLPIPFRCIATDLNTGRPHVFDSGPLGEALRATMSLPGIFTPVKEGDTLYADGGMLDNLPIDVVKKMGAGLVIGVHLDANLEYQPEDQTMFSVMGRSISLMIAANELRSMQLADVLIAVQLKGFTSSSYARGREIIARGYEAAAQKSAVLMQFAVSEDEWQRRLQQREARKRTGPSTPEAIQVTGVNGELKKELDSALSDFAGEPLETSELERELREISGVGRYSRFSYRWSDQGSKPQLVVNAEERGYAPPFLNLGIEVDGTDYNNVKFSMTGRVTALDVGAYRAEWRTDFSIGSTWALGTEYYRPFTATSRWFVAPHVSAVNNPFDLYFMSTRIASYRYHQYTGGVDVGYQPNRFSELRIGYDAGYFRSDLMIGIPVLPTPAGRTGVTSIRYDLDKFDSPIIPREGLGVRARAQWWDAMPGATEGFPLAELYVADVQRVSTRGSVFVQAYGGSTFGYNGTGLPQFFLGGPGHLGAYGEDEIRGDQYFLGRLGYLHKLFPLPPLIGDKAFLTSAYEIGKAYGPQQAQYHLPMDVAAALVMETFLGPVSIGGSVGDTGHRKWYFQIGRIF
jgi:NTE family protein